MTEERDKPKLVGINHVALEVGDIADAITFYEGILNFSLRGQSDSSVFLDMGDQFLALTMTDGTNTEIDNKRHIGIVVDDRDALVARLEDLGIPTLERPGVEIRDPWGNRFQFVEYKDIQFTKGDHILRGMGLETMEKSESARKELREKGLVPKKDSSP